MILRIRPLALAALYLLCGSVRTEAAEFAKESLDFFEAKIRPVLVAQCYSCHSADAKSVKGGYRLDTRAGMLKGGESGKPAVVPGDPTHSPLISAIKYADENLQMPPKEQNKLSVEQISDFENWVSMGAPDPRAGPAPVVNAGPDPARAKSHWAFQKPQDCPVPAVKRTDWAKAPLDQFILAKLEEKGLSPSPLADRRTLIRRASFDLIGLPPTPAEVEAFVNDPSPDAYDKLIDRLLASPQYGERWGRYWLDLARYADTKGYVFEEERRFPYSYTYRDWVIRAFNEDLPYDQFLVQQIAADRLLLGEDKRPLAAMGFLTIGRRFLQVQPDIIDDRIDVVTRGTMALTVSCARCHDHKFDPIPTKDYYSLYGVFASSPEAQDPPTITSPTQDETYKAYDAELRIRQAAMDNFLKERHAALLAGQRAPDVLSAYLLAAHEVGPGTEERFRPFARMRDLRGGVVKRWREFLEKTVKDDSPHHAVFAAYHAYAALPAAEFAAKAGEVTETLIKAAEGRKPLNPLVAAAFAGKPPESMGDVAKRYADLLAAHAKDEPLPDAPAEALRLAVAGEGAPTNVPVAETSTLFKLDDQARLRDFRKNIEALQVTHPGAPAKAMALEDAPTPSTPRVFVRGNVQSPGEEVPRQFLEILSGEKREPFKNGSGRLEMAQAIASRDNPLTARVMVNRVWLQHFGSALVSTTSDFGLRSEPPSHPELLDWLAVRFMNDGWSIKKLHKLMMLSATYQQTSDHNAEAAKVDPENRLIWRMNRRRLDFEAFRDSLIAVTGKLDLSQGGRPVEITGDASVPRRTVYGFIDRQNLPGMFRAFDFASPDTHSPQRFNTTVPQQALFMLNSPFVIFQAQQLLQRPDVAGEADAAKRVDRIYQTLYGRPATTDETAVAAAFVQREEAEQAPPSAWQYGGGRFDSAAGRVVDFRKFEKFDRDQWHPTEQFPDPTLGWVCIGAELGHPGPPQAAAVRRWTAPRDGVLSIAGTLEHKNAEGDGVQGRIVSSRLGELSSWTLHHASAETKLEGIEVKLGDTIDFVVECRADQGFDNTAWAPVLRMPTPPQLAAGSEGVTEWNAKTEFSGPRGGPALSPWEKYAQVLLESNEFVFVD